MECEQGAQDKQQADRYLLILSILLGISVLKLTEVLTLGGALKAILAEAERSGLTSGAVGIFLVVAAYFVFFTLMLLSVFGIWQFLRGKRVSIGDVGNLVAMCVGALGVAYAAAFSFAICGLAIP